MPLVINTNLHENVTKVKSKLASRPRFLTRPRMSSMKAFVPCLTKKRSYGATNDIGNDMFWGDEPLIFHSAQEMPVNEDNDNRKISHPAAGCFPTSHSGDAGDMGSNKRRKVGVVAANAVVDGTPETAASSAFADSPMDWTGGSASISGGKKNIGIKSENDVFWVGKTAVDGANGVQLSPESSPTNDVIGILKHESLPETPMVEPNRRLFSSATSEVSSNVDASALEASIGDQSYTSLIGETILSIDPYETALRLPTMSSSAPIIPLNPSLRDTQRKKRAPSDRRKRKSRRRERDLVNVVCHISKKCSELQTTLDEKDSDIERLRSSHEALIQDLNRSSLRNHQSRDRAIRFSPPTSQNFEKALRSMQETANSAKKDLDRVKKDHAIEISHLKKSHDRVLNEQHDFYTQSLEGMSHQMSAMNIEVNDLRTKNHYLNEELEETKHQLHEESTRRAQENLDHVYEIMDMTRNHEKQVSDLKRDRADLTMQVEERDLEIEEMRMSLELVKCDADYAVAKLDRVAQAHREEVRSIAKESDDRFFKMMAVKERECDGMNTQLKDMFETNNRDGLANISQWSANKFD